MQEKLPTEKEKINGTVAEIVYYNSVNGYAVCDIETGKENSSSPASLIKP